MISHAFRDLDALPIAGRVPERDAVRASVLSYVAGASVFVLSMLAFYFLGSLQVTTSEISTSQVTGASCKMLSAETSNRVVDGMAVLVALTGHDGQGSCLVQPSPSTPFCPCKSMTGFTSFQQLTISYKSTYFPTYDACISSIAVNCNSAAMGASLISEGYSISCNFTADGSISYQSADPLTGSHLDFYLSSTYGGLFYGGPFLVPSCSKPVPTVQQLSSIYAQTVSPSTICAPFFTNPPYLCSVSSRLSPLQMVAQSVSLSTNAVIFLGMIFAAFFKSRQSQQAAPSRIAPTPPTNVDASHTPENNFLVVDHNTPAEESHTGAAKSKRSSSNPAQALGGAAQNNAAAAAASPLSGLSTSALEKTDREDNGEKQASIPASCVAGAVACCACVACGGM